MIPHHSSVELVYDALRPNRPHLVEQYEHEHEYIGRRGRPPPSSRGARRHVRSKSDSHALDRYRDLPYSRSLVEWDDDEDMDVEDAPPVRGGSAGMGAEGSTAPPRDYSHWSHGAPSSAPHLIPDDRYSPGRASSEPKRRPPKSIIKKKKRPPSPDPPPHLLGGAIYSDEEHDDPPLPSPSHGVAVSPDNSMYDEDDDGFFGLVDMACAPLCRNVRFADGFVTDTWTRPRMGREEARDYFYQRSDYREFKMQSRYCLPEDSESDDEAAVDAVRPLQSQQKNGRDPSGMEYEPYSSKGGYDLCASAALCEASEAFWSCFPGGGGEERAPASQAT